MRSNLFHVAILTATAAFAAGCAFPEAKPRLPRPCPAEYSFHYHDLARRFCLCLPTDTVQIGSGWAAVFTGYSVPGGTGLQNETITIVPGDLAVLKHATPYAKFRASNVTFRRVEAEEIGSGHVTRHIIYTWYKMGEPIRFDFAYRALDVSNPGRSRFLNDYNEAAQIRLSEEIMSTFERVP